MINKKIKDLTREEIEKICVRHSCENCPLILFENFYNFICLNSYNIKENLNKIIEVEDNDNN